MSKLFVLNVTVCALIASKGYLKLKLQKGADGAELYEPSVCFSLGADERADEAVIRKMQEQLGIEVRLDDLRCFHVRQDTVRQCLMLFFRVDAYSRLPESNEPGKFNSLCTTYMGDLPDNVVSYLPEVLYCWQRNIMFSSSTQLEES